MVALTFDMGGRVEPALDIMNWLIANNVKATIFPTGSMIETQNTNAGRQVLALVAANPHLFELGNHSYGHPDFTTISDAQIRQELQRTEAAVATRTSMPMKPRFRPPYGAYNTRVLAAVGAAGYSQTLMWDIDTIDWRPVADGGPTASQISAKVVNNAQGGSIVLMHLGGYNTYQALPSMVSGLRERGFHFVRLSDMLGPHPELWVNHLDYGSAAGGFYWKPSANLVWTAERGWHIYSPMPRVVRWVNHSGYGSAGGGFYLDARSGRVWTAERGWHSYSPQGTGGPTSPFWVNYPEYGNAGGGFYWSPSNNRVWTAERGWHAFSPPIPRVTLWVNDLAYGSKGGGFYLDPVSNQVWTAERGWHRYSPQG